MSGIDSYSVVPAENATCTGGAINYAEGMPPSAVNNTGRQSLTDIRNAFNDLAWFVYGTGTQNTSTHLAVPAVYASGTSFTIAGADVTLTYHVYRRVRAVGVSTGTIYGTISITSYSPTTTTVTVVWDSGSLSNETLVISLSQIPFTGVSVPSGAISGTKTNNAPAAGTVGEYLEAVVADAGATAVTSGASTTVVTLSLTPGDWHVWGNAVTSPDVTSTTSAFQVGINAVTNTLPPVDSQSINQAVGGAAGRRTSGTLSGSRITLTTTSNVYLVANVTFAVSTLGVCGYLKARRLR